MLLLVIAFGLNVFDMFIMASSILPPVVTSDNYHELLSALSKIDGTTGKMHVDLSMLKEYEPFAICALLAQMDRWRAQGRLSTIEKPSEKTRIHGYLQFIGFFEKLGIGGGRGVGKGSKLAFPFAHINASTRPEPVASELAEIASAQCGASDEVRKLLQYAIGEVLMNIKQHSAGDGYVVAHYLDDGLFNIGVADNGIGIRTSFLESTSPILLGKEQYSDAQWIDEAIKAHASSKRHMRGPSGEVSPNRGIGLTMCRALSKECLGRFMLVSYSGDLNHSFKDMDSPESAGAKTIDTPYNGVLCSITFSPTAFGQTTFRQLRECVLDELGLGPGSAGLPQQQQPIMIAEAIRMKEAFHGSFLADGTAAAAFVAKKVMPILESGGSVSFDFSGIDNMTDSFSNACFAHLFAKYPREFGARISFVNCNSQVHSFILTAYAMSKHSG